ncbi:MULTISPECIES: DUF294 nucleotidyltransferase-like domain-containing protein [Thiomicrorhabdus]|uniref:CBS domain-containing protein n=1 Tax=Thiomicrorhabdus heinhorstiae TaxID=2748010 RepID=A0ABS0BUH1_9GAMM|nr:MULTISPECIES: DUF294 nucleotidyltransferase-like domain-containing protein [Thiomicrorhabdus]MBF6056964.1 CBS domain-containing protein [Thiomicrorhabdus heinhorstiae]
MASEQQLQFLQQISPFSSLPIKLLSQTAQQLDVVYFPSDSVIKEFDSLFIVIKGLVKERRGETVLGRYAGGSFFGEQLLLGKSAASVQVEFLVEEEAILYSLPKSQFAELLEKDRGFYDFFHSSIAERLDSLYKTQQMASATEVMMDTVCLAPIRPLLKVKASASLAETAQILRKNAGDACLVEFAGNLPESERFGLFSSSDLLKALAEPKSHDEFSIHKVGDYASRELISVHQFDFLFNALLKITRHGIDRLVVRDDQGFIGFLTQQDLMILFADQSGLALIKIDQADNLHELLKVSDQIDRLIDNLHHRGIKSHYIAKMVNELHRKIMQKLVELLLDSSLRDKVCLLVMGSEGRSEQILRTDQDNALLFADDLDKEERIKIDAFSDTFSQALLKLGFPPCPGGIMLNQPRWRQSYSEFCAQLHEWFDQPCEESFMWSAIFSDAECVYGNQAQLENLKKQLFSSLRNQPIWLHHFAAKALQFPTPVGFLGGLITIKNQRREWVNLKKGGIFPIVHGVRCYALEAGVQQTNTHWRIKALMDLEVFEHEFGIELGESLNFLQGLRLESMLQQQGIEEADSESIDISVLSHLQQDLLKEAFRVVERFKKRLSRHFKLHEVL